MRHNWQFEFKMSDNPWGKTTKERRENLIATGLSLGVDQRLLHNRPMSDIRRIVENAQNIQNAKKSEEDAMGKFINSFLEKKATENAAVRAGNPPPPPMVATHGMQIGNGGRGFIEQTAPHTQNPIVIGGSTTLEDYPFNVIYQEDTNSFLITPGTVAGYIPTIDGTPMNQDPPPMLAFGEVVYFHIITTLYSANDYVYAYSFDYVNINSGSTKPSDNQSTGNYYVTIATFAGGVKTLQAIRTSLNAFVEDNGQGQSKGILSTYRT